MTKQHFRSGVGNQVAAAAMVFENPEFGKIRTLTDSQGEPLFCGKDVCEALGYKKPVEAIRQHVSPSDTVKCGVARNVSNRYGVCSGKQQLVQMLFINESGFYSLVFGSKLDAAKRFTHWVTSEVLPQIRKNGCYYLRQQLKEAEQDIDRLLPRALYSDSVLESISCYTTTQVAKELGCTAQELNRSLCACHVQYYQSGQYMLYAHYAHQGLAKSRTHFKMRGSDGQIQTSTYLVWTEQGRKFIHQLAHTMWELAKVVNNAE